jgi:hypothetical protein
MASVTWPFPKNNVVRLLDEPLIADKIAGRFSVGPDFRDASGLKPNKNTKPILMVEPCRQPGAQAFFEEFRPHVIAYSADWGGGDEPTI